MTYLASNHTVHRDLACRFSLQSMNLIMTEICLLTEFEMIHLLILPKLLILGSVDL